MRKLKSILSSYSVATQGRTQFNFDAWEGYRSERDNILKYIEDKEINNT